jgi:T5SS/PEP-CTERM-associated repeat protein
VRIEQGARVASAQGLIGAAERGNGVVMVDGRGSAWDSTGAIRVGVFGRGTLHVKNGGAVNGLIEVGSNSLLTFDTTVSRATIGVNRGTIRMLADASAEAGFYPALRSNDGTFQVVGACWTGRRRVLFS